MDCFEPVLESNSFTVPKDKWVCIHRFIGKSKIEGYKLRNRRTGEIIDITPQELKKNYSKYEPINLKLTKDNKIFYTPYKEVANIQELIRYNELLMNTNLNKVLKSLDKKTSDMTNHELEVIHIIFRASLDFINALGGGYYFSELRKKYNMSMDFKNKDAENIVDLLLEPHGILFCAENKEFKTDIKYYKDILKDELMYHASDASYIKKIASYTHQLEGTNLSFAAIITRLMLDCVNKRKEFLIEFIKAVDKFTMAVMQEDEDNIKEDKRIKNETLEIFDCYKSNNVIKYRCLSTKTLLFASEIIYDYNRRENDISVNSEGELAIPLFPYTRTDIEKILNKK